MRSIYRAFLMFSAALYLAPAVAQCEGIVCEFGCRGKCQVDFGVTSVQDKQCFNTCLSSEQACRAGVPAVRQGCRTSPYYDPGVKGLREARRAGVVTSFDQCRQYNSWITKYIENQGGGPVGKYISDTCGCYVCEEGMQGPDPRPGPEPARDNPHAIDCRILREMIQDTIKIYNDAFMRNDRRRIERDLDRLYETLAQVRQHVPCPAPPNPAQ